MSLSYLRYAHPYLYEIFKHWPVAVFLPSVLLLLTVLALVTRWWDARDAEAAADRSRVAALAARLDAPQEDRSAA